MKRIAAVLALAASLLASSVPAFAADRDVKLTMDGRPVDRAGATATLHNGVVYGNLVNLVKSFNGLLTFQGNAVEVSIGTTVARFTAGSRTVKIGQGSETMRGPVFQRNGDFFVPLDTFVLRVANAKLNVDRAQTHADIVVNANPQS